MNKGKNEGAEEEMPRHGLRGSAERWQSMMPASVAEHCGSLMREMVACCMDRFRGQQEEPHQSGADGGEWS